jgi:hypothetical protein
VHTLVVLLGKVGGYVEGLVTDRGLPNSGVRELACSSHFLEELEWSPFSGSESVSAATLEDKGKVATYLGAESILVSAGYTNDLDSEAGINPIVWILQGLDLCSSDSNLSSTTITIDTCGTSFRLTHLQSLFVLAIDTIHCYLVMRIKRFDGPMQDKRGKLCVTGHARCILLLHDLLILPGSLFLLRRDHLCSHTKVPSTDDLKPMLSKSVVYLPIWEMQSTRHRG